MYIYIISIGYWFCVIVQYAVLVYTFVTWFKVFAKFQNVMSDVMNPLLRPIRKMLERSVFRIRGVDISPIILYLIAGYGAQLCVALR